MKRIFERVIRPEVNLCRSRDAKIQELSIQLAFLLSDYSVNSRSNRESMDYFEIRCL